MARIPVIDQDACIGCETCTRLCPAVFCMVSEHKAGVCNPTGAAETLIEQAMDACPAACITWDA